MDATGNRKWQIGILVLTVGIGAAAVSPARAADETPTWLPFELNRWYEYSVTGLETDGVERFRVIDATGSDGRRRYQLQSVLHLKQTDGAYRRHETYYTFEADGGAVAYRGESDTYMPGSPLETGERTFSFAFDPAGETVAVRIKHTDWPAYEARVFHVPRRTFALDRHCFSHVALVLALAQVDATPRKKKLDVFTFADGRLARLVLECRGTAMRQIAGRAVELIKIRPLVNNLFIGTCWVRQSDRLLLFHSNERRSVTVTLQVE